MRFERDSFTCTVPFLTTSVSLCLFSLPSARHNGWNWFRAEDFKIDSVANNFIKSVRPYSTRDVLSQRAPEANGHDGRAGQTPFGKFDLSFGATSGALVAVFIMALAVSLFFIMRMRQNSDEKNAGQHLINRRSRFNRGGS